MYADLHIHSVLSPCADREMIPQNIFPKVRNLGINIFAICDHNSAWNVRAFCEFGEKNYPEIGVVPGIEITTQEEIHVVSLLPSVDIAEELSGVLEELLPQVDKHPDIYFPQQVVDSEGNPLREIQKPLYYAVELNLEDVVELIRKYEGIIICAHVDRPSFSVVSQLGFIPETLFDVVEISPVSCEEIVNSRCFELKGIKFSIPERLPIISSSDAHSLDELGRVKTKLELSSYKFEFLRDSFSHHIQIEVIVDD